MAKGWRGRAAVVAFALVGLFCGQGSAQAGPLLTEPVAELRPTPELRLQAILRRILIANRASCTSLRHDHGLVVGAPAQFPGGAPVVAVLADSPAAAAGLRRGDLVRGVNGTPWSPDPAEGAAFARALGTIGMARELTLVIERDDHKLVLTLTGQPACPGEARLAATRFVNATAIDQTVIIEGGLEQLLPDDAELAFAVAHEAAHIILGHTAPDRRSAIGDRPQRLAMERDADALGLRLMARAGYDPAAAGRAWPKIADASRPPLLRLMDIHGPYMSTAERTAFLTAEAMRLTAATAPLRNPRLSR